MLAWEALTVTETQTGPLGGEGNQVTSGDRSGESVRGKALWAGSWHCLSRHLVENKIVCWLPFSVTHKWSPCYSILCEQFCWPPSRDKVVARGTVRTRSCFHLNVYIISMLCCSPPLAAYRISRSQAPWGRKEGRNVPEEGSLIQPPQFPSRHCASHHERYSARVSLFSSPCLWLLTVVPGPAF